MRVRKTIIVCCVCIIFTYITPIISQDLNSASSVLDELSNRYSSLVVYKCLITGDIQITDLASGEMKDYRTFDVNITSDIGSGILRYEYANKIIENSKGGLSQFHAISCDTGSGELFIYAPRNRTLYTGMKDEYPAGSLEQIKVLDYRFIGLVVPRLNPRYPEYEKLFEMLRALSVMHIEERQNGNVALISIGKTSRTKTEFILQKDMGYAPTSVNVWSIDKEGQIDAQPFIEISTQYRKFGNLHLPVSSSSTDRTGRSLYSIDFSIEWPIVNQPIDLNICSSESLGVDETSAIVKYTNGVATKIKPLGEPPVDSLDLDDLHNRSSWTVIVIILNVVVFTTLAISLYTYRRKKAS